MELQPERTANVVKIKIWQMFESASIEQLIPITNCLGYATVRYPVFWAQVTMFHFLFAVFKLHITN